MYLTSDQTSKAEVLIRLTSQGFVATASEPHNLSQPEPYEVVTIDYTVAVRAALEAMEATLDRAGAEFQFDIQPRYRIPRNWEIISQALGSDEPEPEEEESEES